jgi:hypothetical protein
MIRNRIWLTSKNYHGEIDAFNRDYANALDVIKKFFEADPVVIQHWRIQGGIVSVSLIPDIKPGLPPVFKLEFSTRELAESFRTTIKSWRFFNLVWGTPKGRGESDYAILSLAAIRIAATSLNGAHFAAGNFELMRLAKESFNQEYQSTLSNLARKSVLAAIQTYMHSDQTDAIGNGLQLVSLIANEISGYPPVFKFEFGGKQEAANFREQVKQFGWTRWTAPQGYGKDNYTILSLSALEKVIKGMKRNGGVDVLNALASNIFKAYFSELTKVSQAEVQSTATIVASMPGLGRVPM